MDSDSSVAEVIILRGAEALEDETPSLFIELPHGATRASHYHDTRADLTGPFPSQLSHFFFVNTDVGSPELAEAVARRYLARFPSRAVVLLCSQIPRTFIDCNRVLQPSIQPAPDTGITPGLPPYVRDPADQALLMARHAAYQAKADALLESVCGAGGLVVMLHTYSPRSVGVTVDGDIVAKLHAAYEPDVFETWPLRPPVDIICRDLDGQLHASPALLDAVVAGYQAQGHAAGQGETYPLHPVTTAAHRVMRYPLQSLCIEIRRDLIVSEFTPFSEMIPDPSRVEQMAAPLAEALIGYSAT